MTTCFAILCSSNCVVRNYAQEELNVMQYSINSEADLGVLFRARQRSLNSRNGLVLIYLSLFLLLYVGHHSTETVHVLGKPVRK